MRSSVLTVPTGRCSTRLIVTLVWLFFKTKAGVALEVVGRTRFAAANLSLTNGFTLGIIMSRFLLP